MSDGREPPTGEHRRAELVVAGAFVVSIVAALLLAVVYVVGGQPQLEGTFLGLALGGMGVGVAFWARCFMPSDEVTEERPELASSEDEVAAFTASFEAGEQTLARRGLLAKLGLGALGALGLAAVFPIRSLGPRPGAGLATTPFGGAGRLRLVDGEGHPIRPGDLARNQLLTAWPEGHVGAADAPTLLLQFDPGEFVPLPGREGWTVENVVAYSKLCTHTGCPVGLYQTELDLLLCPCHQSTFDVLHGAEPVFGPAARPLPQLPLDVDDQGFLIATADFSAPVGGGYWDRGRSS
jgi:ubiquinol-cytochrome c reductase iron-sulfur subunit